MNDIDDLKVSDKWKRRFHLLNELNADTLSYDAIKKSEAYRALPFKDRVLVFCNFWAFFFSFFFYFQKGMHLKGVAILAGTLLWIGILATIDFFLALDLPGTMYWIFISALCGMLANHDYYRKTFNQEKLWSWLPNKWQTKAAVVKFLVISVVVWGGSLLYAITHTYTTEAAYYNPGDTVSVRCGGYDILATQNEVDHYGSEVMCAQRDIPNNEF